MGVCEGVFVKGCLGEGVLLKSRVMWDVVIRGCTGKIMLV